MRWLGPVGWCLLPLCLGLAALVWIINPWFLDEPGWFFLVCGTPLVLLGLLWGALRSSGHRPWGLIASAILVLVSLIRPAPEPASVQMLIVGIDGATWQEADDLSLPHLQGLRQQGMSGILVGEEPLFSPLLWTTMATGKRPADHGIRGFRVRGDHAQAARFWDVAQDAGKSVGLYKWLVTYPPPESGPGFVVPAWLAPAAKTHPKQLEWVKELELSRRLKRKKVTAVRPLWRLILAGIDDGLRWSTVREGLAFKVLGYGTLPAVERDPLMHRLRIMIDRDVFIAQLHRSQPDVATLTMYATDALGHTHWGLDGNQVIHRMYALSDDVLGEAIAAAGPDATVMVISDHGFRSAAPEDRQKRSRATTEGLRLRLTAEVGPVDVARVGHKLTVSALTEEPGKGQEALRGWLQGLMVDSTGLPLYQVDDVPDQPYALGLTLRDEAFDPTKLDQFTVGGQALSDFVKPAAGQAGEHDPNGIAVLAGPGIERGDLGEVSQLDVTPTILSVLGIPAARDMPGRAWVPESGDRVPTYDHLAPSQEAVDSPAEVDEQQLRALGYVE